MIGDERGTLRLLFDPDTLKLLGVHVMGESATEIIHIGQAVLSMGGTIGDTPCFTERVAVPIGWAQ